ncbi:structural maintenance of chromosomes flexible hinge domain-containing protein GMI1-like isoform X2 [Magnolia sinica]|uniref:structural maintenance of chromosomes flexible hinge domain-containing protein GMI1-like isoform X2 n=1 Tax=Magnolia sinica TaxID=86752 RepID=UPI0026596862|nr:structural maintenance of chromosomes flexible hinge domain-containing protein GMI1-like isoform X2 [Magnolia sinica]
MFIDEFVDAVRMEFGRSAKRTPEIKQKIMWDGDIYLEDLSENKIRKRIHFNRFKSNKLHTLGLFEGAEDTVDTFQNMWDLTPDTDLLSELPAEYTFETALADLIDNSLQAVWSNTLGDRRLVRSINSQNHLMDGLDLALICHIGTCTGVQMGVPLTFVSIGNLLLVNMRFVLTSF